MAVQNPERYASQENLASIFTKIEQKLQNRYTKAATDSAIASAIAGVKEFDYTIVQELPVSGTKGVIYLVANDGTTPNLYDEYLWIVVEESGVSTGHFEKIGAKELDISGKLEKADVKADGTYVVKTNDAQGNGFTLSLSSAVVTSLGLADSAVQAEDIEDFIEGTDVKVDNATLTKTADQSGNGFTLGVKLDPIGGLTQYDTTGMLDSIRVNADGTTLVVDPTSGILKANIDNNTLVYDSTSGKVKVADTLIPDVSDKLEKTDVLVGSGLSKTNAASGNAFTLNVALEASGQSGLVLESGSDPAYGPGLRVKVDNSTIDLDSNGALKVSDDFQVNVESLTTEQVNTLKAIFTDDTPASGSGS